eukprot:scaffold87654_cov69-Phaeocystis_antarctica.AAC.4
MLKAPVFPEEEARPPTLEAIVHVDVHREHAHTGLCVARLRLHPRLVIRLVGLVTVAEEAVAGSILGEAPALVQTIRLPLALRVRVVIPPVSICLACRFRQCQPRWNDSLQPSPDSFGQAGVCRCQAEIASIRMLVVRRTKPVCLGT